MKTSYVSFLLSRAEAAQLQRLTASLAMSRSAVVRRAIAELAERHGIPNMEVTGAAFSQVTAATEMDRNHEPIKDPPIEYAT